MYRTIQLLLILVIPVVALFIGCAGEPGDREFRNGVRELEQGRHVRAMALLEKSISRRPASDQNAAAHSYIGVAAWRLGRVQRAMEAFEESRRLDPGLFEPTYNLAVLYLEAGDTVRAVPLFEEAARMAPQDPRPLEFLGHIHLQAGQIPAARRAFFGALARAPQSARVLTSMALVDRATGDSGKAVFYLMQALERNADYAPALYNLAVIYRDDLKDEDQARATFKRYLEVEPDEVRRIEAAATLRQMSGELPVAKAAPAPVEEPVAVAAPAVPVAAAETAPVARRSAEELMKLAREEAKKRNTQQAVTMCLEAAEMAEQARNVRQQEQALRLAVELGIDQARAQLALGRFLSARGDSASAIRAFKQATVLDAQMVAAHAALADEALKTGEYDAALVAMRQVVQLEPDRADTWWALASLYDERLGVPARAADSYREFVKRFPGDPRVVRAQSRINELVPPARVEPPPQPVVAAPGTPAAAPLPRVVVTPPSGERRLSIRRPVVRNTQAAVQAYNRGTLYQQREDWVNAIFFYTRALENDDTFVTAYFNLAAAYWAKGDHELAKDAYRLAIEFQPDSPAARFNLALLHRELRERDAAVAQLNALLETTPDHAQAHYVLGLLHSEAPVDVEKAREHYRKFLELAPNDPSAGIVREWLRAQ